MPACTICEKPAEVLSEIGLCPACGLQRTLVRALREGLTRKAANAAASVPQQVAS